MDDGNKFTSKQIGILVELVQDHKCEMWFSTSNNEQRQDQNRVAFTNYHDYCKSYINEDIVKTNAHRIFILNVIQIDLLLYRSEFLQQNWHFSLRSM